MLTSEMITEQNAETIIRLVFATKIRVKDERMKKVILYAKGSRQGLEYPILGSEACAPIYGEEYTLLFEDAYGNRFTKEISSEVEPYLQPELFLA